MARPVYRQTDTQITPGRTSGVKCRKIRGRGQSGITIKLFQALRKISFNFHILTQLFILDDVKLPATV